MPLYEYYCADCQQEFQLIRPVSQAGAPGECDVCGRPGQRQLSNFAFKSNTFTSPKFKASLERPRRARPESAAPERTESGSPE